MRRAVLGADCRRGHRKAPVRGALAGGARVRTGLLVAALSVLFSACAVRRGQAPAVPTGTARTEAERLEAVPGQAVSTSAPRMTGSSAPQYPPKWPAGRIVVWTRNPGSQEASTASLVDPSTGVVTELWSETARIGHWAPSPTGQKAAYSVIADGNLRLVVRDLEADAKAGVVAEYPRRARAVEGFLWSPDGARLLIESGPRPDPMTDAQGDCLFETRTLAQGRTVMTCSLPSATFARSYGCPVPLAWEPDKNVVAVAQHSFEDPFSNEVDTVDLDQCVVDQRLALASHHAAMAPSPDGQMLAALDSAVYYGERLPYLATLNPHADFPPKPARASVFRLVDGSESELLARDTVAGFTMPVWGTPGEWLAFAEPQVVLVPAAPDASESTRAYPGPRPTERPVATSRGSRIWVLGLDGDVRRQFDLGDKDAWPVASSPDGSTLLVAVNHLEIAATDLFTYAVGGGQGKHLAAIPGADPHVAWLP